MKILLAAVALVAIAVVAGAALVYVGWYNVAASEPHTAVMTKLLRTIAKNSVEARAQGIRVPDFNSAMVAKGAVHYKENCAVCHGAPGVEPGALGKGLTPQPPEIAQAVQHWDPGELYWIVKHGIRMTGMPAWGATHSENELWAIVAFLTEVPKLDAQRYQQLAKASEGESRPHRH
jgi:mono/diheme cytochrome c family protein